MNKENKKQELITVCIPTLNTLEYLKNCISSLKKSTKLSIEILVLDLGNDGTDVWCKKNKIKFFKHEMPFYFAQSNNFLVEKAKGELLLFLNPDTIPQKNFLENMVKELENGDIIGAKLIYPNTRIQHAGIDWKGKFPAPGRPSKHIGYDLEDDPKFSESKDVKAVTGACMLIRKDVFKEMGQFDEQFTNCYEDVDLCIRATILGYKVRYRGDAVVKHYVSGSKGTDGKSKTTEQFLSNCRRYLFQKYGTYEVEQKKEEEKELNPMKLPEGDYNSVIVKNTGAWKHRVLVGTATTGTVRMEWVVGRYGQIIPTNWSYVDVLEWISSYAPMEYLVADAQNLIVRHAIEKEFDWVLFYEQDNIPLPDAFVRLNKYMQDGNVPIVSGLYFTKSSPPEPILYRGRGNSHYKDWKMGDKVWVDGVPTGFLLVSGKILKAIWDESPEYLVQNHITRRVFDNPQRVFYDAAIGGLRSETGTSDLEFCTRIMKDGIFEKAGFLEYQKMPYPYLVDTNLFLWHIDTNGRKYPLGGIPEEYMPKKENE